jgi:hypothetical protein
MVEIWCDERRFRHVTTMSPVCAVTRAIEDQLNFLKAYSDEHIPILH